MASNYQKNNIVNNMKQLISFIFLVTTTIIGTAQYVDSFDNLHPNENFDNIHVQKLNSDSLSTTFAIWVKLKVRMHKHAFHTENVYITEGKGNFYLADSSYSVKKGDLITIPKDTWHGVEVTSKSTMKVISIQSPEFKGIDRIFQDE